MIMYMCAVRDQKADVYGRPFFVQTEGVAIRNFSDEVLKDDENNPLNKHPEDFSLYTVGTYNDADGSLMGMNAPKLLIMATQCFKKK